RCGHASLRHDFCRDGSQAVLRAMSRYIQVISARRLLCSTTGMLHQFQPITEVQEMQHPGNAVFNLVVIEVQLARDLLIRQSLPHPTIDGKKYAQSSPKSTHCAPAFSQKSYVVLG